MVAQSRATRRLDEVVNRTVAVITAVAAAMVADTRVNGRLDAVLGAAIAGLWVLLW